uniref:Uncharacterized protein n=1 Tax=Arundo donax TaxID=35708 RepID=A0A0A8ZUQ0_ARUDO
MVFTSHLEPQEERMQQWGACLASASRRL